MIHSPPMTPPPHDPGTAVVRKSRESQESGLGIRALEDLGQSAVATTSGGLRLHRQDRHARGLASPHADAGEMPRARRPAREERRRRAVSLRARASCCSASTFGDLASHARNRCMKRRQGPTISGIRNLRQLRTHARTSS